MKAILQNKKKSRDKAFDEVKNCSIIDPSVVESKIRIFIRN